MRGMQAGIQQCAVHHQQPAAALQQGAAPLRLRGRQTHEREIGRRRDHDVKQDAGRAEDADGEAVDQQRGREPRAHRRGDAQRRDDVVAAARTAPTQYQGNGQDQHDQTPRGAPAGGGGAGGGGRGGGGRGGPGARAGGGGGGGAGRGGAARARRGERGPRGH